MKTLVKYYMTVDGEAFEGYFKDHIEAADYLDEGDRLGIVTIISKTEEVTVEDILADSNLKHIEKVEYVSMLLLPNYKKYKKIPTREKALNKLGFYF